MQVTHRFRLYPNINQEEKLLETLDLCRLIYNYFLSQWDSKAKIPSRLELQAQLPEVKREKPELNKVHSKVLQMALYHLYSNLKALSRLKKSGKRVGRLRFKGKGWFKTFTYNQSGFKLIRTGKRLDLLYLSKIGDVPVRLHRGVEGNIKQVIIKKHNSGRWVACVCVEGHIPEETKQVRKAIGLDMGVKHFLTDSEGRQIENLMFYEKSLRRIRILHRDLSRKKKGSENRARQRMKLANLYEKLVNQRDDFLHKLSRFYANNYDLIVVENLNISNMVRNRNLAGKILDASWGKFLHLLEYKAARAGVQVVKVNPRGTSREGDKSLDRDYRASLNILMRGWGSPKMPVEMEPLLVEIPASTIIEAGSPPALSRG